jgi:hypothetical protein
MKTGQSPQLSLLKIAIPLLIVVGIIIIFKGGYQTGQWLYAMLHP